jgi:hypothetical protein
LKPLANEPIPICDLQQTSGNRYPGSATIITITYGIMVWISIWHFTLSIYILYIYVYRYTQIDIHRCADSTVYMYIYVCTYGYIWLSSCFNRSLVGPIHSNIQVRLLQALPTKLPPQHTATTTFFWEIFGARSRCTDDIEDSETHKTSSDSLKFLPAAGLKLAPKITNAGACTFKMLPGESQDFIKSYFLLPPTANSRSQWALPEPNRERQISVGPQPRAPDLSGRPVATARPQPRAPELSQTKCQKDCQNRCYIEWQKECQK